MAKYNTPTVPKNVPESAKWAWEKYAKYWINVHRFSGWSQTDLGKKFNDVIILGCNMKANKVIMYDTITKDVVSCDLIRAAMMAKL